MIVQKLTNVRMNVCAQCAYHLHQENGMTKCRFPKEKQKECSVETDNESWLDYRVYKNEWKKK